MLNLEPTAKLQTVLTVSELTAQIRESLEESFSHVAVVGEISNTKIYPSGHWYFSLKDKEATLSCVCFKNANQSIKFELEDGLMIVARGKLSVYPPRGSYQLVVTRLEPVGIGAWQLAFDQLRAKLDEEGLLAPSRKRAIPLLPRKIGVVTSPAGAALRDILSALKRRNPNICVVISPCKVQGEGSAEEIAGAIKALEEVEGIEAVLVARGGGSIEDLWSFNTEVVARAVAECPYPVISGVGHETDTTICDLVADLRAPTPTAAAELVASGRAELMDRFLNRQRHMLTAVEQRLTSANHRLERLNPWQSLLRYEQRLKNFDLKLAGLRERLCSQLSGLLTKATHSFTQNHGKLIALGPENVLARGFAILRKMDGQIVRSVSDVKPGETLEALLHKGKLKIQVLSGDETW